MLKKRSVPPGVFMRTFGKAAGLVLPSKGMLKKVSMLFMTLVTFLSFANMGYAATIIDKSTVDMEPGDVYRYTRTLYLQSGAKLGIYVDNENNKPGFEWYLTNAKTGLPVSPHGGRGDANYVTGAPVGYYYITLHCEPANCDAKATLSVQK